MLEGVTLVITAEPRVLGDGTPELDGHGEQVYLLLASGNVGTKRVKDSTRSVPASAVTRGAHALALEVLELFAPPRQNGPL